MTVATTPATTKTGSDSEDANETRLASLWVTWDYTEEDFPIQIEVWG